MPPKKDKEVKEKPIKGDQAEEMVLQYLRSVNRPYASTDVSTNLKNKVTKPEAQKALIALAEKGQLTMKLYGKQSIFVYNQSQLPVLDPEEFSQLDAETKEVQGTLDERRKELKTVSAELASMEALPKTKELGREINRVDAEVGTRREIRKLTHQNTMTLAALAPFRGDGEAKADPMSAADRDVIDKGWIRWRKEWTDRKKLYKSIMGILGDAGMVANQAEFEDEQGVEVDDDEAQEVDRGEFGAGAVIRKVAAPRAPSAKGAAPAPKAKPAPAPAKKVLGKRTRSESASQDKSGESAERDSDDDDE
ncbi:homologous-pairing protein 2 [Vanrija pseudolonga]|uniref:Homologous-pairing protein 2 n=1 Tax=Vanrija pseudolonga TaxID=143232 RepID=A0AAF0YGM9_9TREE|nr:Homologous-pairing protein 2 [Vanrija pseudolonga]